MRLHSYSASANRLKVRVLLGLLDEPHDLVKVDIAELHARLLEHRGQADAVWLVTWKKAAGARYRAAARGPRSSSPTAAYGGG